MHLRLTLVAVLLLAPAAFAADPPNVVLIVADDMGYSDVGCFGAKGWKTPHLDQLAQDGVQLRDFRVSQPVCSASRASLLTGCYANRIGLHGALGPNAKHGIADEETTLGELFKSKGYATAAVGKWHLGHLPRFLPTKHGFDSYFGLPYSNDMWPNHPTSKNYPKLPLLGGGLAIDDDVTAEDQAKLTGQYTERAVKFIGDHKAKPFFLYVAHSMPHVPLFASEKHKGKSEQGLYGDVIEEIDAGVGAILAELKKHDLEKTTLVIFTSDNGPWLGYGNHAGTKGPLREGKGTVFEGGVRVPCIARWPGQIPPSSIQGNPLMSIDLFPTLAKLIGAELPKLPIDGKDAWPLFACEKDAKCPHEAYFHYYAQGELQAVRSGKWKLMLPHTYRTMNGQPQGADGKPGRYRQVKIDKPELYDLEADVSESKDVAAANPEVVKKLLALADAARDDLGDSLTKKTGTGVREPGRLPDQKKN
jgi:arylsulfatase A